MRVLWLVACSLLSGLACEDERPGLALHVEISPPEAASQLIKLVVTIEAPDGDLPMRDVIGSGVQVHADGHKATLTFAPPAFTIRPSFDVLVVPTGASTLTVNLSGVMYRTPDGKIVGSARPVAGVLIAPGKRTSASLAFACADSMCPPVDGGAPPGTIDLAMPPDMPKVVQIAGGNDNDQLVPLAVGHFGGGSRGDLVMGAPARNAVYVFRGRDFQVPGFQTSYTTNIADITIFGRMGESLGTAAAAGDFDGDGKDDLVVTSAAMNNPGVAYIFTNARLLDAGTIDLENDLNAYNMTSRVVGTGTERLGAAVVLAHVHSQVFADLIVSAPGARGTAMQPRAGRVYVVFGSSLPSAIVVPTGDPPMGQQDATLFGPSSDGNFGLSLAAGELDGMMGAELVIGAYADAGKGTVFAVRGSRIVKNSMFDFAPSVMPPQYDLRAVGNFNSKFGFAVAVADVDGTDGNELIVSARDEAKVYLLDARSALQSTGVLDVAMGQYVFAIDDPSGVTSSFGSALATGNLDGDAAAELIIGAPTGNGLGGSRMASGAAYVVRGSAVGALSMQPRTLSITDPSVLVIYGAAAQDQLGGHVGAGNFDVSDPFDEIVVGAEFGGANRQGKVYAIQDLP